jgi:hypothetical protein
MHDYFGAPNELRLRPASCDCKRNERDVPLELARLILAVGIKPDDKQRTRELLAKQRQGRITVEELDELDSYIQTDRLLAVLKTRAMLALKELGQAP